MNLMDRLCDKPEWIAPEPGREHHKSWHQLVTHPDARLMAAAPELLDALQFMLKAINFNGEDAGDFVFDAEYKAIQAIKKATGGAA